MSNTAHILTDQYVIVVVDNNPVTILKSHPKFFEVISSLTETQDVIKSILVAENKEKEEYDYSFEGTNISAGEDGLFYYHGKVLDHVLQQRIQKYREEKMPTKALVKMLDNLMSNPSSLSVADFYDFAQNQGMPIDSDGMVLAYKGVRDNYMDVYTGKVDNSIGQKPSMPRNLVDDNNRNNCSTGYHVGALEYAHSWGDRVMLVRYNPANVVAVPKDHSCQKCRVTEYEVIGEVTDFKHLRETYISKEEIQEEFANEYIGEIDEEWEEELQEEISTKELELQGRIHRYIANNSPVSLRQVANSLSPNYMAISDICELVCSSPDYIVDRDYRRMGDYTVAING